MAANREHYKISLKNALKRDVSDKEVEDMRKFVFEDRYTIKVPQEMSLQFMIQNVPDIANLIRQMRWVILQAPKDGVFITSDNPFVMIQTQADGTFWGSGAGLLVQGTETTIPLTSKICVLILPDKGDVSFSPLSREAVRSVNTRTTTHCLRFLFSSNEPVLKRLVKKTHLWEHRPIKKLVHVG